jgi:signal transduction histidine kinase
VVKTERFISIEQTNLIILAIRLVSISGSVVWAVSPQLYTVNCNKAYLILVYNIIIFIYTAFFILRLFIKQKGDSSCYFCLSMFLLDDIVISYFIYITGGASSPFYSGYFVTIAFSAFVLGTRMALFTAVFGAASYIIATSYYGIGAYNTLEIIYRIVPLFIIAFPTGILSNIAEKHIREIDSLNETLNKQNVQLEESLNKIEKMQKQLLKREKEKAFLDLTESIAHRFRNPLMSIGGMADVMEKKIKKSKDTLGIEKYVQHIKTESKKLSQLLDNFLQMSDTSVNMKFASIQKIVDDVFEKFEHKMASYNIKLKKNIDAKIPPIRIDEKRFKIALSNIIEESIETMKNGGTLSLDIHVNENNDEKVLEIEIADTSVGMPKEILENIFKPFESGGDVKKGVSLPIAKHSIELIGGILEVDSKIGKGTTFKIILPI